MLVRTCNVGISPNKMLHVGISTNKSYILEFVRINVQIFRKLLMKAFQRQ